MSNDNKNTNRASKALGIVSICTSWLGVIPMFFGIWVTVIIMAIVTALTLGQASEETTNISTYMSILNVIFSLSLVFEIPAIITGVLSISKAIKAGATKALGIIGLIVSLIVVLLVTIFWISAATSGSSISNLSTSISAINNLLLI